MLCICKRVSFVLVLLYLLCAGSTLVQAMPCDATLRLIITDQKYMPIKIAPGGVAIVIRQTDLRITMKKQMSS